MDSQIHTERSLRVWIGGKQFRNPLGVAAGFDTTGKIAEGILNLGFGFCEIGSCVNSTSASENSIRMNKDVPEWTNVKNASNIQSTNSLLKKKIANIRKIKNGRIGINIGLSEETMETIPYLADADYMLGIEEFIDMTDYLVINLTAPKPYIGVEQFKDQKALEDLLVKLNERRRFELGIVAACEQELTENISKTDVPLISRIYRKPGSLSHVPTLIFLKISTDLSKEELKALASSVQKHYIDGIIVSSLPGDKEVQSIKHIEALKTLYEETKGNICLVSVGGITNGKEAYKRIKAGASLVQIYTALLLEGPYIGIKILKELKDEMKKEGIGSIQEVIGADCRSENS